MPPLVNIGDPAPDFTADDIRTGVPFHLSEHFGKVIVLTFVSYT